MNMTTQPAQRSSFLILSLVLSLLRIAQAYLKPITELSFPPEFDVSSSCILCDLDGTLLNSHHQVSEENLAAIKTAIKSGFRFIPATGRTRISMQNCVGDSFVESLYGDITKLPGVYQQGLLVYGLDGELIYERTLDPDVIEAAVEFCDSRDISLVAYSADQIYCGKATQYTDRVLAYKDPTPVEVIGGLGQLHNAGIKVNKLIILTEPENISRIRSEIEPALSTRASFTQAVPDMLEILPLGGCKGDGVKRLLQHIGVRPADAIAFGDGENDIEMLELVGKSVAMANAKPKLKEVAEYETIPNTEHGVAYGIDSILLSLASLRAIAATAEL